MRDLTRGPLPNHILAMALPIGFGMLVQTLYYLVDLYFVSQLGDTAIAGVSAAGNVMFLVMAVTQVLSVGTVALVSHAAGRDDRDQADLVFNQAFALSAFLFVGTLVGGYLGLADGYMTRIGADEATVAAGLAYLRWFLVALSLQFLIVALGAALRGTGVVKPTMVVQMLTVVVNIVLTPILVAGWITGHAFGVAGAGMASAASVLVGVLLMTYYFFHAERYVAFRPSRWRPRFDLLRRLLAIGLPSGGEFALLFVYVAVIYRLIRDFGPDAQAGFGVGMRVMQAIFLPAMAIAFATPAIAGQNFGARLPVRVRGTFRSAAWMSVAVMAALTLICQIRPSWFVAPFSDDPEVLAVAAEYLRIISLNFVATGLIFTSGGMFQAMGNTVPSLLSSATRLVTFVLPAIWVSGRPGFELRHLWYMSVATVGLQAAMNLALLYREFGRRLKFDPDPDGRQKKMATPAGGHCR